MAKTNKPPASNEDRGLVRYVDPADPEAPWLESMPPLADRQIGQLTEARKRPRKPKPRPRKKSSKKKR